MHQQQNDDFNTNNNSFLNLPTDLHCYICSFLLGELFNNSQERLEHKFKFSTTRKSHLCFSSSKTSSSVNSSNNNSSGSGSSSIVKYRNFPSHDSQYSQFHLNSSPLQFNDMMMLFSLKNTCRKMSEFVSECEELWHSLLISLPCSINYQSRVEKSWMIRKNLEFYHLLDHQQQLLQTEMEMVDDLLNILFVLNKLCRVEKVVKRISVDYQARTLMDMRSRFSVLEFSQISGRNPLLTLISVVFENLEELIVLPKNNMDLNTTMNQSPSMSTGKPFRNLKHLVVDTELVGCIDFIKDHSSTLEYVTFVSKSNNFKTIQTILMNLLQEKLLESEVLKSVEFIGPIDLKYLDHIQLEYLKQYGSTDVIKYLSKIKNLSIFQFSSELELGNVTNQVLISNMVELTLVQFQGGDVLDLSHLRFPNLKILNMKGCMQSLILGSMQADSLESMQLRMFVLSGSNPVFHRLKYLTLDNCNGIGVVSSWFNDQINLKSFTIIPNKSSLASMELNLSNHKSIHSISVTGCQNVKISHCKNLDEIYLIDCKEITISTVVDDDQGDYCRGLKILEIENKMTEDEGNSSISLNISKCFYVALKIIGNFQINTTVRENPIRIEHLDLIRTRCFSSAIEDVNLDICNMYITDNSKDAILSIVEKSARRVKNQFGISYISNYWKPILQFEFNVFDPMETYSTISSTLQQQSNSSTLSFTNVKNVICNSGINEKPIIHFGQDISMLCWSLEQFSSIKEQPTTLFKNIAFLNIGPNITDVILNLADLPLLEELTCKRIGNVSLQAHSLTHSKIRSIIIDDSHSLKIKFTEFNAPKLVRLFLNVAKSYDTDSGYEKGKEEFEITRCDFPALVFHSSQVKVVDLMMVQERRKGLEKFMEIVKELFTTTTTVNQKEDMLLIVPATNVAAAEKKICKIM